MDKRDREDQLNEIRIMASIFHPNVLAYYEAFIENGKLFIVTEFADKGDLDHEIEERKKTGKQFREPEIWSILLQSMAGLRELHNHGILHRDIKCQNILKFTNDTDPQRPIYKLADFGVSKCLHEEEDFTKTQIGTPYYLCPEIWQQKQYNAQADIFSLGVVLYELCTLKHPYNGRDMKELNKAVMRGQYMPISSVYSKELRELCYQMLDNNPDKRPTIREVFLQPQYEAHFGDSPVSLEELNIGQETALEAKVDWEDPTLLGTIALNPKLMAAMANQVNARQNPYQRYAYGAKPQVGSAEEIQKQLPQAEYKKREEFERLQKIHEERAEKRSQVASAQGERQHENIFLFDEDEVKPKAPNAFARPPVKAAPETPVTNPKYVEPSPMIYQPNKKVVVPSQANYNPLPKAPQPPQQQQQFVKENQYVQYPKQMQNPFAPKQPVPVAKPASVPQKLQPISQQSQAREAAQKNQQGHRFW